MKDLAQIVYKARHQPISTWGQACVVKLLSHSSERLAVGDWKEAIDAAERALRRERRMEDGRTYAARYLVALRRAAQERAKEIEQKKAIPAPAPPSQAKEAQPRPVAPPERSAERAPSSVKYDPKIFYRFIAPAELAYLQSLHAQGWNWGDIATAADWVHTNLSSFLQHKSRSTEERIARLMAVSGERPLLDDEGRRYLTREEIEQLRPYQQQVGPLSRTVKLNPKVLALALQGRVRLRPEEYARLMAATKEKEDAHLLRQELQDQDPQPPAHVSTSLENGEPCHTAGSVSRVEAPPAVAQRRERRAAPQRLPTGKSRSGSYTTLSDAERKKLQAFWETIQEKSGVERSSAISRAFAVTALVFEKARTHGKILASDARYIRINLT